MIKTNRKRAEIWLDNVLTEYDITQIDQLAELLEETQWIDVNDRLPIEKTDSFSFYKTVEVIVFDGDTVFSSEFRAGNTIEFWSEFDVVGVTHWMPLPDPPD